MLRSACADFAVRRSRTSRRLLSRSLIHSTGEELGDTIAARAVTRSPAFPRNLSTVGFAEPLFDSFALITRRGAVPPVVHALTDGLEEWAADLADHLNP